MLTYPKLSVSLPSWIAPWLAEREQAYPDPQARMRLVIELSRQNVERKTGGPFAAAIFDLETSRLVAPGVNQVLAANCSLAHAEMLAIALAQQLAGSHELRRDGHAGYELVSSTEPCAMCMGAIPWSGIRALACGARDEDARQAGFDEGDKVSDWRVRLEARGIRVTVDVCREAAAAVIRDYAARGGVIY